MKRSKILLVSAAAVLVCCAFAIPAFAEASYQTPAQAAAGVTGMTLEEVQEERAETGKTYGEIAAEYDRLAEFQEARQSMREEAADTEPAAVSSTGNGNGACDGSCNSTGICDGSCLGAGNGNGTGVCDGTGAGNGNGNGVCDGSCNSTGVCDGSCLGAGNGNGNGVCDGTGAGNGNGNGVCDGTGSGNVNGGHGHHNGSGCGKN